MSEILYDPACVDCRQDAAKDRAGTTWQCNGHVRAERDWLRARLANVLAEADHDIAVLTTERNAALTLAEQRGAAYDMTWREGETLREWKDKLEAERDEARHEAEQHRGVGIACEQRAERAERERDEARAHLKADADELRLVRGAMAADDARLRAASVRVWGEDLHGCDTPDAMADLIVHLRAERDALRAQLDAQPAPTFTHWSGSATRPDAPPAPATTEADIRKHRSTLLQGLAYIARESWWPDDASVTDRVREMVCKMRDATDALSSPAPSAPVLDGPTAEPQTIIDTIRWVLNDAHYKAPEQIAGCWREVWAPRLRTALDAMPVGSTPSSSHAPECSCRWGGLHRWGCARLTESAPSAPSAPPSTHALAKCEMKP